ncbi:DUF3153 domain-containing protein [Paenibacillus polygoni]|uniref:DUF3153 domain-containing protein n=1 Tax=Paenibacillus polygoni TaxID=3050112 RepID=A0ABY8X7H7_9BACL|nr:DUF3153 domain-containing protein [Paenibacillus polygoni]WIV21003.1 DUF3153 domain-containing protein [Paenibacillus polygoni]
MKNRKNKCVPTLILSLLLLLLLSACAKGEAHVTVHTDGTADVNFNLQVQNRNIKFIGHEELVKSIEKAFEDKGFVTENVESKDGSEISASKEVKISQADNKQELPESISYSTVTEEGFFFSKHKITVDADLMSAIPDHTWTEQLTAIPNFVRNLLLKDVELDFKLTLPIKPESSNADIVTADGKTMTWHIEPLSANHLELSVNTPHIQNIIITAVASLLLIGVMLFVIIRKVQKNKRNKK